MKIAVINSVDNGSTGKIALECVQNNKDIEYKFFVGRKYLENEAILFTKKWERGSHSIFSQLLDVDEQCSRIATRRLVKELKEFNPDVIHLHNLHGYYINYVILFKFIKSINVKVVWTLHDCWSFTGHCAHFDYINCNKWKTQCKQCPNLHRYPSSKFFDRSRKLYNIKKQAFLGVKDMTIVCPSKWLANLVKQSFLGVYPIKLIYNGINLDNFKPTDNRTFDNIIDRSKNIVLAVASSWGELKGYNDLFKVRELLNDRHQLVVVGVTEEQKKELESANIIGINRTNNQVELAELYSLATVFVNTTYEDNFPTVNIEALACGCPVVTYNTGGSPETIDNTNGFVVDKGDFLSVIKKLPKALLLDRQKISNDARTKYNQVRMCNEYYDIYKKMFFTKN